MPQIEKRMPDSDSVGRIYLETTLFDIKNFFEKVHIGGGGEKLKSTKISTIRRPQSVFRNFNHFHSGLYTTSPYKEVHLGSRHHRFEKYSSKIIIFNASEKCFARAFFLFFIILKISNLPWKSAIMPSHRRTEGARNVIPVFFRWSSELSHLCYAWIYINYRTRIFWFLF